MINRADIVSVFIKTAQEHCTLENVVYIPAYPNTPKSSFMKNTVAAFSVYYEKTEPEGLGSEIYSGRLQVKLSVYTPFKENSVQGNETAEHICRALCSNLNITGVKTLALKPDTDTECMVTRVIFTLDDEIAYGQED